jgi:hypothetical protein
MARIALRTGCSADAPGRVGGLFRARPTRGRAARRRSVRERALHCAPVSPVCAARVRACALPPLLLRRTKKATVPDRLLRARVRSEPAAPLRGAGCCTSADLRRFSSVLSLGTVGGWALCHHGEKATFKPPPSCPRAPAHAAGHRMTL